MVRSKIAANVLLLLGSVAMTVIFAEVALRLLGISYPYWSRVDELTGFSPRPGVSGWPHDEGNAFVRMNSAGLRDREHSQEKPSDTVRIAVLGDSYTEAKQVDVTETFWSVAERKLQACSTLKRKQVEMMNFGVSGYGTAQEWLMLQRIWPYHPDGVLLAFYPGNDILNNSRELEHATDKPYVDAQSGALIPDFSFRKSAFFKKQSSLSARAALWIIDHSRVAQVAMQALRVTRQKQLVKTATQQADTGSGSELIEAGLDPTIYMPPKDPAHERAWQTTERLIEDIATQAKGHGSLFFTAVIPTSLQTLPSVATREHAQKQLGVDTLFYAENRIAALGARAGFPVLKLGVPMQKKAQTDQVYFNGSLSMKPGTGHWNAKGHAEAGALIAQSLCQIISNSPAH